MKLKQMLLRTGQVATLAAVTQAACGEGCGTAPCPNESPTASFDYSCPDLTCDFTEYCDDTDGTVVAWSWDFGDGATSTVRNPTHPYASGGTYTVRLEARDDRGATGSVSHPVTVTSGLNEPPTAAFTARCSVLTCEFADQSSDRDGTVDAWSWNFGDTHTSTARNPTHVYASGGTYSVRLDARDNRGATGSVSHPVTVEPTPVARVLITPATASLYISQTTQLTAVAQDSAGGVLENRAFTWASSDTTKAKVSSTGMVTATGEGSCSITAESEGKTGTAELTVGLPTVEVAFDTTLVASFGVWYQPTPRIRVMFEGEPVSDYPVEWAPKDSNSGWLFPISLSTDEAGYAASHWAPGEGTTQSIQARGIGVSKTMVLAAQAVPGKSGAGVWVCGSEGQHSNLADGYRVTLNAATDPYYTYYAAMQFSHGYFGYQITHPFDPNAPPTYYNNPYEKIIIFSVWDADGVEASLQEAGVAECRDFVELDGHGVQCTLPYLWLTDQPYSFEIQQTVGNGYSEYTTFFTDVSAGERMMFARIRLAPTSNRCFATWIEDFGPETPSCLDIDLRDYRVTDPFRRIYGSWEPMTQLQMENRPVSDRCANHSITKEGNGVRVTAGDTIFQAPFESQWMTIP